MTSLSYYVLITSLFYREIGVQHHSLLSYSFNNLLLASFERWQTGLNEACRRFLPDWIACLSFPTGKRFWAVTLTRSLGKNVLQNVGTVNTRVYVYTPKQHVGKQLQDKNISGNCNRPEPIVLQEPQGRNETTHHALHPYKTPFDLI